MDSVPSTSKNASKKQVKQTRKKTNFYLVGYPSEFIPGSKLPTLRQALQVLLFKKNVEKKERTTRAQVESTVDCVLKFWGKAGIKTITKKNCVKRMQKKYQEWCCLSKSKSRVRDVGGKRALFESELDKLWDIGADDAVKTIRENRMLTASDKDQDIAFYADQQSMRKAIMLGKDKIFKDKVEKMIQRRQPPLRDSSAAFQEMESTESKFRWSLVYLSLASLLIRSHFKLEYNQYDIFITRNPSRF